MNDKSSHYHAYLLRFWRDDEQMAWRASLEDPHTGEKFGFPTLQRLYEFLDGMLNTPAGGSSTPPDDDQ